MGWMDWMDCMICLGEFSLLSGNCQTMRSESNLIKRWFGVRTVVHHLDIGSYEERIILVTASDFDEALVRAGQLTKEYVSDLTSASSTGFFDAFEMYDQELAEGMEVFSLLRTSNLKPKQYIDRFFHTGMERSQHSSSDE